jgi:hypothetical protein
MLCVGNHGVTATEAERAKAYRDRLRGSEPRSLLPCGTYAAAKRHRRKNEPLDRACLDALAEYQRQFNSKRSAR